MSELRLHWQDEDQHRTRQLSAGGQLKIGRHSDCDIVIAVATVSRRHALIYDDQGAFIVRNLSQTNPILLNQTRFLGHHETANLQEADEIQIGPVSFSVSISVVESTPKIRCINCHRILEYDPTGFCPWCGMALAAGQTVMDLD